MKKAAWIGVAALCVGVAAWGRAQPAPPASGAPPMRVEPGQVLRYGFSERDTMVNNSPSIPGGGRREHVYQTDASWRFTVSETGPQGTTLEMVFERLRVVTDSDAMRENPQFDTGAPAAEAATNPLAPVLLAVVNKPITVRLDATGEVRAVEPPAANVPEVRFAGLARELLSAEWLTPRVRPVFSPTLGGTPLTPGVWTVTREVAMLRGTSQRMELHSMVSVKGQKDDAVLLAGQTKASLLPHRAEDGDDLHAELKGYVGGWTATWPAAGGTLHAFESSAEWTIDTTPNPTMRNLVQSARQTEIIRLK